MTLALNSFSKLPKEDKSRSSPKFYVQDHVQCTFYYVFAPARECAREISPVPNHLITLFGTGISRRALVQAGTVEYTNRYIIISPQTITKSTVRGVKLLISTQKSVVFKAISALEKQNVAYIQKKG